MTNDLGLRCKCAAVAAMLENMSPDKAIRFVCHCDDCQASARVLGHPEMLDANGGTSAAMVDSSRLNIVSGLDRLAAIRVAAIRSRPVLRWHCAQCRTPLFNTYETSKRSFLSVLLANADKGECRRLLGSSVGHVWTKFATGDARTLKRANLFPILSRLIRRQIAARLTGDWRNTPLFDRASGLPIVAPRIVAPEERAAALAPRQ